MTRSFLLLATLTSTAMGLADPSRNEDFCSELVKIDLSQRKSQAENNFMDLLRIIFKPELYGKPLERRVLNFKLKSAKPQPVGRNLIFSIGPETIPQSELKRSLAELDIVRKQLGQEQAKINRFYTAKNKAECLRKSSEAKFDFARFAELKKKEQDLRVPRQYLEAKVIQKKLDGLKDQLWLDWDLVNTTDLVAVREALLDPSVRNIILVSHALSTGQLVDSMLGGAPLEFFDRVSQGLLSLSVFSCHSEKAVELYELPKRLARRESWFGARLIFSVPSRPFMGSVDVTPAFAFGVFLREVDRRLGQILTREKLAKVAPFGSVEAPWRQCSVEVGGVNVTQGEFGLYKGSLFLGVVKPQSALHFTFPCIDLEREEELHGPSGVLLRSLAVDLESALEFGLNAEVRLQRADRVEAFSHAQAYRRTDGSIKALRFQP